MSTLLERLQAALGTPYRIDRELTGGGMSRVFLATEVRLSRQVVVKVLPPDMANAMQAERFTREIEVAASLQHPHIVPLLTAGSEGDLAWYIMPYVTGETLAARVARQGALPIQDAVRILRDVVDALAYSHANGIVHRDIKPANVMFSGKHALVTDFGVAKALSALSGGSGGGLTSVGITLGTPTYMAPEQAVADPHVDHRADLYAVGVMAYEMLTGRTPFMAATPQAMLAAHVTSFPDPITQHRDSLPPALAAAVMKCLAKTPGDRWQSAEELGAILESWGTPSGGTTPVTTAAFVGHTKGAEETLRKARFWRVAGIFAVASVVVVGVIFGLTRVFGLPDWVWVGAAGLMALGAPIIWYTGRVERRRARAVIAGKTSAENPVHYQWFTWRRAFMGGALALGALLLTSAGFATAGAMGIGPARTLLSSGVVAAGDRFILADFVNRTNDSAVGSSITEALRVDLGQSRLVRIVGDRDVAAALARMTLPRGTPVTDSIALELAKREGVKAVIAGEIAPLGTGYVLTARVLDAATGATQTAVRATATDASALLTALNDLSAQLRERVGESLKTIRASEPLDQVTTRSLEALRHYSTANRAFNISDFETAKAELELALAADPEFAMAHRRYSATLNNLGAPRSQINAAATAAFQHSERLTPYERAITAGNYYRQVERDYPRATTAYREALAIDSLDQVAISGITQLQVTMDQWADVETLIRRMPPQGRARSLEQNLIRALSMQGKWAAVDSALLSVAQNGRDGALAAATFGATVAATRRDIRAVDSIVRSAPPAPTGSVYWNILTYARTDQSNYQGRFEASDAEFDEKAAELARMGSTGQAFNYAVSRPLTTLVVRGDEPLARRQLAELLRRYPLEAMEPADRPFDALREMYARFGELGELRRVRASFEAAIPVSERAPASEVQWDLAEAVARRDDRAAIDLVRRFRVEGYCTSCGRADEATWWVRVGEPDSALAVLERSVNEYADPTDDPFDSYFYGSSLFRTADLAEAKGDRAKARDYYQRFIDAWRNAEPAMQPRVAEAKRRLAVLGSDAPR